MTYFFGQVCRVTVKGQNIDRRIIRTKQLLKEALITLINEKGYDAITVQDLADRATVNRATFYLHYHDKQDLLDHSMAEVLSSLEERLRSLATHQPVGATALISLFEHVAEHADFYAVMLGKRGFPGFMASMTQLFQTYFQSLLENCSKHDNRSDVPKEITIRYITSAYLGVILWWLENGMPYPPEYMASQLFTLSRAKSLAGTAPSSV
nr:TetR/AcrR family transcriptional regulator [Brevibacillus fulvus]